MEEDFPFSNPDVGSPFNYSLKVNSSKQYFFTFHRNLFNFATFACISSNDENFHLFLGHKPSQLLAWCSTKSNRIIITDLETQKNYAYFEGVQLQAANSIWRVFNSVSIYFILHMHRPSGQSDPCKTNTKFKPSRIASSLLGHFCKYGDIWHCTEWICEESLLIWRNFRRFEYSASMNILFWNSDHLKINT